MRPRMKRTAALLGALVALGCSSAQAPTVRPEPKPASGPAATTPQPPPSRTGSLLYRPVAAAAYAFERRDSLTLQLPGGATQVQQFDRTAYLTISIAGGSGSYRTAIHLDSLRQEAGGTVPTDSLLRAEGTNWTATLSPEGRLSDLRADRPTGVGDQLGANLVALFPVLPPTGLQEGVSWTDTTQRTLRADAFDATERAVTGYRAAKSEGRAITIESNTAFQRSGKGGEAGQAMEMASQGTRRGNYRFGTDGMVLAGEGADSSEMTISVPAVGQSVPVSQRASWRIATLGKR